MIKETLKNGFEVEIPDENLDDYELLEDLAELDEDDYGKIVSVYRRLLGKDQYKALKEHIRNESGRVPATEMMDTLEEIFNIQNGEVKNS
ncbi:MAG: hypothetical protein Q4C18_05265 [Eubacteriales bacterium]|nr:hypothetical protein [Eubacteriales bacterium]